MRWTKLCDLARELPEVTIERWWGTPGFKVSGKGFARLKEDAISVMFGVEAVEEQQMLIETRPHIYFITDHYKGYPAVLARLATLTVGEARDRLERAWRLTAKPALVTAFDAPAKMATKRAKVTARYRPKPRKSAKPDS